VIQPEREAVTPVDQREVGERAQGFHRAAHREQGSAADVQAGDLLDRRLGHGDGQGPRPDLVVQPLAHGGGEPLAVVESRDRGPTGEDHRRREHGAGEAPAADLIDADDDLAGEAPAALLAVEFHDPPTLGAGPLAGPFVPGRKPAHPPAGIAAQAPEQRGARTRQAGKTRADLGDCQVAGVQPSPLSPAGSPLLHRGGDWLAMLDDEEHQDLERRRAGIRAGVHDHGVDVVGPACLHRY